MSGRGKGRGKGRGGKSGANAPTAPKSSPAPEVMTPFQLWLKGLLKGSTDESFPKLTEETIVKTVKEVESVSAQILKQPKHTAYQKHAISLVLVVQTSTNFTPAQSRKVVCNMFTFLMDELTKYWHEHGFTKESVHSDYWKKETPSVSDNAWTPEGMSQSDYENWVKAFAYLRS